MGAVTEAEISQMTNEQLLKISQEDVKKLTGPVAEAYREKLDQIDKEEAEQVNEADSQSVRDAKKYRLHERWILKLLSNWNQKQGHANDALQPNDDEEKIRLVDNGGVQRSTVSTTKKGQAAVGGGMGAVGVGGVGVAIAEGMAVRAAVTPILTASATAGPVGVAVAGVGMAVVTIVGLVLVYKSINGKIVHLCECDACVNHRGRSGQDRPGQNIEPGQSNTNPAAAQLDSDPTRVNAFQLECNLGGQRRGPRQAANVLSEGGDVSIGSHRPDYLIKFDSDQVRHINFDASSRMSTGSERLTVGDALDLDQFSQGSSNRSSISNRSQKIIREEQKRRRSSERKNKEYEEQIAQMQKLLMEQQQRQNQGQGSNNAAAQQQPQDSNQ